MSNLRFVVTGSSRGLGLAFVNVLAKRNHHIIACVRDSTSVAFERSEIQIQKLDVTEDADCDALAEACADGVDCLVHNAAIGEFGDFESESSASMLRTYDVNTVGAFRVTRALLPLLIQSRGRIVFVSSDMGSMAAGPTVGRGYAYRMSKVALNMLAKNLAHDLAPAGVASICVHPGWMHTSMGGPNAPLDPKDVAEDLANFCEMRGIESTGKFLSLDGREIVW